MTAINDRNVWTFSANGTGDTFVAYPNKPMQFVVNGTLGGGTVTLNSKVSGGSDWVEVGNLSAVGVLDGRIFAGHGESFQVVVSGATTPTITAILEEVAT